MPSIRHTSPLLRYGVAVLAVGVAFGLKLLLDPLIVQDVPFLLVFGAIMVSAWFAGLGPGLLATVAAGLTTDYFFLDPRGTVSGFSLENVPLLVFFLEGTLVCLLAEALRAARSRAESSKLEAKRHRERLCRNEEHFRSLVEGMRNYAIFTLDPQGAWQAGTRVLNFSKAIPLRRSSESTSPCSSPKKTPGWASLRNTSRRRRAKAAPQRRIGSCARMDRGSGQTRS